METLFWVIALSLPILPNLWCIWHASRHDFPMPGERARWVRAGTFAPIIGGILYLAVGMRRARPRGLAQTLSATSETGEHGTNTPAGPAQQ